MTTNYVSAPDFDAYIYDDFGTIESGIRLSALKAAERAVNEYTQRSFAVAGTGSARLFVPSGTDSLHIHDCTTVTSVSVSGSVLAASNYQLEPFAASWAGLSEPYNTIRLLTSRWWVIYPGEATISVTATWGWSAVPDDVVEATKIIAKDILGQRKTVGGMAAVGDFGGIVRLNPYVRTLLNPLRSRHAFGFA